MYGKAYGENVSLQASFNDVEIINGTITSTNTDPDLSVDWADLDVLVTFSLDSSVTGSVPFTATVSGGTFIFHTFHANYCGDVVDGGGAVVTPSVDHITDISFDAAPPDAGHNNITIAGVSKTPDLASDPTFTGAWNWVVEDGETISMDINVSAVS
jgi:hypothetical protein